MSALYEFLLQMSGPMSAVVGKVMIDKVLGYAARMSIEARILELQEIPREEVNRQNLRQITDYVIKAMGATGKNHAEVSRVATRLRQGEDQELIAYLESDDIKQYVTMPGQSSLLTALNRRL